jgi:pyruvate dehydrogenase E1 component beta subunit
MSTRELTFREAISEAFLQAMQKEEVFIMGAGVDDPKGIFGTTLQARKRFGKRVFDVPLAENSITGIAIGAALAGMRPVVVHARNDFALLTMDQIVNHAAKWKYMSGGVLDVPITIRCIVGRGWGQAAQHSQSLQALFAHVPGLQVLMPATPQDAKGLLLAGIQSNSPTIYIEHRWLYDQKGPVPEEPFTVPIGKGMIRRSGEDVTIVAISYMLVESLRAAEVLQGEGINPEVIDLRSVKPWDKEMVFGSVRKTGRLVIADTGWRSFGVASEIACEVGENLFGALKSPIKRITLPDAPTPASPHLERAYYPGAQEIVMAVKGVFEPSKIGEIPQIALPDEFKGPF